MLYCDKLVGRQYIAFCLVIGKLFYGVFSHKQVFDFDNAVLVCLEHFHVGNASKGSSADFKFKTAQIRFALCGFLNPDTATL